MVDWEFWGSPKVWKVVGVGFLLIVFGIALLWAGVDIDVAMVPFAIGGFIILICAYYFVYLENWILLRRKSRSR